MAGHSCRAVHRRSGKAPARRDDLEARRLLSVSIAPRSSSIIPSSSSFWKWSN